MPFPRRGEHRWRRAGGRQSGGCGLLLPRARRRSGSAVILVSPQKGRAQARPRQRCDSCRAGGQAAAPPTRAWVWLKGVSVLDFAISGVVCPPPWSPKTPDSNPGASKFHTRESRRNASRSPSVRMRPVPNCGGKRASRHLSCSTNQGHLLMPFFSCVPT